MAPIPGAIPKAPPAAAPKEVSRSGAAEPAQEITPTKSKRPPSSAFAVPPAKPMSITGKYVAPSEEVASRGDLDAEVSAKRLVGASKTVPYRAPGPQSADSQAVDDAMAASKASGASQRDQVLAGAREDDGKAKFDSQGGYRTGKERIKDMMRDTAGKEITDKNLQDGSGKIAFPAVKDANGEVKYKAQKSSWCGIYATDIWRRSGAPVKWEGGTVVDSRTGKGLPQNPVDLNSQASLKKIKPGDMITIQTLPDGTKGPAGEKTPTNLNHHALVESAVYEDPKTNLKTTVPPAAEPEGANIVGYNVRQGNSPQLNGNEYDAINSGYVPVAAEKAGCDAKGNHYSKRLQSHIELPPPVDARVDTVTKPKDPNKVG